MIVVFTSLENGGILQLANQITETLVHAKYACKLYVPKNAYSRCSNDLKDHIIGYSVPKTINPSNAPLKALAAQINALSPETIIVVDDAIRSNFLLKHISTKTKKALLVHDVAPPPQNFSIRKFAVEQIHAMSRLPAFSAADKIVLLVFA